MATTTEIRRELTSSTMETLIKLFEDANIIYDRTKDYQTLTFEVGEITEKGVTTPVYGSIKFTLHKANFDLDEAILEYEDKVKIGEEREDLKAKKKALALADREKKKKAKEVGSEDTTIEEVDSEDTTIEEVDSEDTTIE